VATRKNCASITAIEIECCIRRSLAWFSAFYGRLLLHEDASKIEYMPLIPSFPTDPCVLKEEMKRLINIAHALGDKWTIITGDQATL